MGFLFLGLLSWHLLSKQWLLFSPVHFGVSVALRSCFDPFCLDGLRRLGDVVLLVSVKDSSMDRCGPQQSLLSVCVQCPPHLGFDVLLGGELHRTVDKGWISVGHKPLWF